MVATDLPASELLFALARDARLNLIIAARHVLHNGLKLLGVSAPESM